MNYFEGFGTYFVDFLKPGYIQRRVFIKNNAIMHRRCSGAGELSIERRVHQYKNVKSATLRS